eukprot:COSAG06_NODE_1024_length_11038_cov_245.122406_17_plen_79_part_00
MHLCVMIIIIRILYVCVVYGCTCGMAVSICAGGAIEPSSRGLFAMVLELMNCGSLAEHLSEMGIYLRTRYLFSHREPM